MHAVMLPLEFKHAHGFTQLALASVLANNKPFAVHVCMNMH